ncbi:MAG: DUF4129 domain-containing protein, partial [Haloarculaceae archaeon]
TDPDTDSDTNPDVGPDIDPEADHDRRRRVLFVALAVLAVLALALGAAGLDEIHLSSEGGSAGYDADQPVEIGDTSSSTGETEGTSGRLSPWYVLAFYVVGVLATIGLAWRRDIQTVWLVMAVMVVVFVGLALLASTAGSPFAEPANGSQVTEQLEDPQLGSGSGDDPNTAPPATALPTGALLLIGVVLGVGAILGFSKAATPDAGDDEDEGEDSGDTADEEPVAEIGAAAGRAADRMATGAPLENPVYRAWRDMIEVFGDAGDHTTTPAEFRDRAIAAGFPREPVVELTALFRAVRYGHEPASEDREAAAIEALQDIQRAAEALVDEDRAGEDGATAPVAGSESGTDPTGNAETATEETPGDAGEHPDDAGERPDGADGADP